MKKSFFISLILHTILFASFYFFSKNISPKEEVRVIKISSITQEIKKRPKKIVKKEIKKVEKKL